MAISTMYTAMPGSPETALAVDITADATSMTVADGNALPAAPNIAVIGDESNAEVVIYNAKSGNTLSGLIRGLGGTTASAWTTGTSVARNYTSFDHNRFKENIEDLATNKADAADVYTQTEIDTLLNAKQNSLTFDSTPTASSTNPVTSGGVKDALDTLDDSKVSKSGDTMTGGLTVSNGDVEIQNGSINVGTPGNSNYRGFRVTGTNSVGAIRNAGDRMTFDQYLNGSTGGERYLLPVPEARSSDAWYAILTSKTIDDTGWLTISKPTGATYTGTARYRRIGQLVYIEVDSIANLTENVNIGYLQSGCRPSNNIFFPLVAGYNQYRQQGLIRIYTSGGVQLQFQTSDPPIAQTQFFGVYSFMLN